MVPIVVDLYCPFTIEHLEQTRGRAAAGDAAVDDEAAGFLGVLNAQIDQGDFFICASEVQRDFWIGALHSRGRINPRTYAADPTLRAADRRGPVRPARRRTSTATAAALPPVLKGVRPGIAATDTVLLWGGSLLDWQDPVTLIEAVAALAPRRPELKLVFMGTKHPNPLVKPMRAVEASRERAEALGRRSIATSSSTTGCRTRSAPAISPKPTSASARIASTSRRTSPSARGCSTTSGRGCRSCAPTATSSRAWCEARGWARWCRPATPRRWRDAIDRLLGDDAARAVGPRRARPARPRAALEPRRGAARALPRSAGAAPPITPSAWPASAPICRAAIALSKWLKRTALRLGVTERRVEQLKRLGLVARARGRAQPRRAGARDATRTLTVLYTRHGRVTHATRTTRACPAQRT